MASDNTTKTKWFRIAFLPVCRLKARVDFRERKDELDDLKPKPAGPQVVSWFCYEIRTGFGRHNASGRDPSATGKAVASG
jgi:hypothetical protein